MGWWFKSYGSPPACEGKAGEGRRRHHRIPADVVACAGCGCLAGTARHRSISAVIIMAEIGDLCRFDNPRQLMSYLGLAPDERSTGETVRRLGITKAGNGRVRRALIESAWTYRHLPRTGPAKLLVQQHLPSAIKDIAAKAQTRLCARYRTLSCHIGLSCGRLPGVGAVTRWKLLMP
jgi:transposase